MWKVTPVGMQNACRAGTWPVANTSELATRGNPIPATAPCQYVCTTLYSIPSVVWFFWPLMKSPRFVAYSREPARTVGEQHGGSWHSRTAAGPKTGKPAPPPSWAGSSSFQEGSAATAACENGATSFIPPRDVRDICRCCGSQAVVAGRQARKPVWLFARGAVRAGEHPLAFKSYQRKTALRRWGFVKCNAGFALSPPTKCYCR